MIEAPSPGLSPEGEEAWRKSWRPCLPLIRLDQRIPDALPVVCHGGFLLLRVRGPGL
jgi:hypothetical protein